jgi:hypothetical protein
VGSKSLIPRSFREILPNIPYEHRPCKAALIVKCTPIDFVHPKRTVGAPDQRHVATRVNELLTCPGFCPCMAVVGDIPEDHMTFADNHNVKKAGDTIEHIRYSSCKDTYGNLHSDLRHGAMSHVMDSELKGRGITDVFVFALGGDHCVAETARDGPELGYKSYVVEEALALHDLTKNEWKLVKGVSLYRGVRIILMDIPDLEHMKRGLHKDEKATPRLARVANECGKGWLPRVRRRCSPIICSSQRLNQNHLIQFKPMSTFLSGDGRVPRKLYQESRLSFEDRRRRLGNHRPTAQIPI